MWVPINEVSATHTDTAPEVALSAGFICLVSGMAACVLFVCIVAASQVERIKEERGASIVDTAAEDPDVASSERIKKEAHSKNFD